MEEILNFVDSANLLYSGTDHKDIEKESPQNFINSTHIEYLRNVASTIASLLNPLGEFNFKVSLGEKKINLIYFLIIK